MLCDRPKFDTKFEKQGPTFWGHSKHSTRKTAFMRYKIDDDDEEESDNNFSNQNDKQKSPESDLSSEMSDDVSFLSADQEGSSSRPESGKAATLNLVVDAVNNLIKEENIVDNKTIEINSVYNNVKEIFKLYDKDGSGSVLCSNLGHIMRLAGSILQKYIS